MEKKQFMAELGRDLSYMTEWDRADTLHYYADLFARAGESGEAELLRTLDSPLKIAIQLHRGYRPSPEPEETPEPEPKPEPPEQPGPEPEAEAGSEPQPVPEPPPSFADMVAQLKAQSAAAAAEARSVPAVAEMRSEPPTETAEHAPAALLHLLDAVDTSAEPALSRPARLGGRIAAGVGLNLLPGLPLAALTLAVSLVLLMPGLAVMGAALLFGYAGVWTAAYIPDSMLIFGGALALLSVGLLILWLGLWGAVSLVRLFIRGEAALWKKLVGRRPVR